MGKRLRESRCEQEHTREENLPDKKTPPSDLPLTLEGAQGQLIPHPLQSLESFSTTGQVPRPGHAAFRQTTYSTRQPRITVESLHLACGVNRPGGTVKTRRCLVVRGVTDGALQWDSQASQEHSVAVSFLGAARLYAEFGHAP